MERSKAEGRIFRPSSESTRKRRIAEFLSDVLKGSAIGIAFIIPGFSGGSVAAILGIYEKLIGAITDLFHHFKSSFFTLLPIALGMLLGVAVLILPIQWGLQVIPLPTVSLFVGLALGGLPPLREKAGRIKGRYAVVSLISFAVAASLVFLPSVTRSNDFLLHLDFAGYMLLFLVGLISSCALVVPGISGSMLLLIFGYYAPLVNLLTEFVLFGTAPLLTIAVAAVFAGGMVVGFFLISVVMKILLAKCPQGTYFAILGFILGSVVAVYAPLLRATSPLLTNPWYWALSVVLLVIGIAPSCAFLRIARRRASSNVIQNPR